MPETRPADVTTLPAPAGADFARIRTGIVGAMPMYPSNPTRPSPSDCTKPPIWPATGNALRCTGS